MIDYNKFDANNPMDMKALEFLGAVVDALDYCIIEADQDVNKTNEYHFVQEESGNCGTMKVLKDFRTCSLIIGSKTGDRYRLTFTKEKLV